MKFLVTNYSCLQNPLLRGYRPQIPVLSVLCPQLNLLNPLPNKIPGYATGIAATARASLLTAKALSVLYNITGKKGEVFSAHAMNAYGGEGGRGTPPFILYLGIRWKGWLTSRPSRYSPGKNPGTR